MITEKIFFHNTIRRYVTAFGSLFKNVHVVRKDDEEAVVKDITIPLTFSTKKKFAMELQLVDGGVGIVLPRLSFTYGSPVLDNERQLNKMNKYLVKDDADDKKLRYSYAPIAYNIPFTLTAWCLNLDDGEQITEQVLPFFSPSFNLTINEVPELNVVRDIIIILDDVSFDMNEDLTEEETRVINWSYNFTLKGYLYPPIYDSNIIKRVIVNTYPEPGGKPVIIQTSEVSPFDAEYDDEWEIVETLIEDYS